MDTAPVTDRTEPAGPGAATTTAETSSADRCPVPHASSVAIEADEPAARCPFPQGTPTADPATGDGACPVMHGGDPGGRSKADLVVRHLLRIPDRRPGESDSTLYRGFQRSMLISATRCTLTYVVFPFLLPFLHFLKGGAPVIGILVSVLALVADTFTIRRFFAFGHKWRWYFSALVFAVMCLMVVLLVRDVGDLAAHLQG